MLDDLHDRLHLQGGLAFVCLEIDELYKFWKFFGADVIEDDFEGDRRVIIASLKPRNK